MESHYHQHATIRTLPLRTVDRYYMERWNHDPTIIVPAAIEFFSRPLSEWDPEQRQALKDWQTWLQTYHQRGGIAAGVPEEHEIRQAVQIFGKIFFFGKLRRCNFAWKQGLRDEETGRKLDGWCNSEEISGYWWMKVEMEKGGEDGVPADENFGRLIGTLLHECVHGFMGMYACNASRCVEKHEPAIGMTGHGHLWLQLASHVEAMARKLLDYNVDLGVSNEIPTEFNVSGMTIDDTQLQGCHPDFRAELREVSDSCRRLSLDSDRMSVESNYSTDSDLLVDEYEAPVFDQWQKEIELVTTQAKPSLYGEKLSRTLGPSRIDKATRSGNKLLDKRRANRFNTDAGSFTKKLGRFFGDCKNLFSFLVGGEASRVAEK